MNCKEARTLFSARFDGELSAQESQALELHLLRCDACDSGWKSMSLTVRLVRTLPVPSPDPSFVASVMDRVRAHEVAATRQAVLAGRGVSLQERVRAFLASPFDALRPHLSTPVFAAASLALVLGVASGYWVQGRHGAPTASGSASLAGRTLEAALPASAPSPLASIASPGPASTGVVSSQPAAALSSRDATADPLRFEPIPRARSADDPPPVEVLTPEWFVHGASPTIQQARANVRTF